MLTIRPFEPTDSDYAAIVAIHNAVVPDLAIGIDLARHRDRTRDPDLLFCRDMIEQQGQIVAYVEYGQSEWAFHPDKYFWDVYEPPENEHLGIRPLHLDHVLAVLAERDPLAITTEACEAKPHVLRFLEEHGFEETMRYLYSELSVASFDAARFAEVVDKVCAAGIRILSLRELAPIDPDWRRKLYELDCQLMQDVPGPEPHVHLPFERFEKRWIESPDYSPDCWLVALDGDQYVGETSLWPKAGGEKFEARLTGVVQSHRRRGIATALKVRAIEIAQQWGVTAIETDNEENNPMHRINRTLGFQPLPAWMDFEKRLRPEESVS